MSRKGQLTIQRKAIYDILQESEDHPTAADIMERLRQRDYSFAYATVYNSLRYLTEEGLITELKLDGDASRYDACTEEHQHIVCRRCGRVDEVFTKIPEDWLEAVAKEVGYDVEHERVLLKGVCPTCKGKTQ
ncbi:Fur family transcriptional regulator [Paenibacillus xerothermodurans]|uniref:Transcriptional repressor n=1 Tax=Paenibacillus xerothermodurans TaxID=1977292 RepID=A0A2W1NWL6_PAEXE|nr:transcriptional repressor [Paenibacillus xerothermodurans]PZE22116.1 transcriptional repressor [Paenibacillus xerothermodurans]